MILITGDTHLAEIESRLSKKNLLAEGIINSKDEYEEIDYIIITGDFGLGFSKFKKESKFFKQDYATKKFLESLPFEILFVDGNHDQHEYLNSLEIKQWNGGKVHKIGKNIYHLMRGEIFTLNDYKFFVMGGAESLDKEKRVLGFDYFEEELPSFKEYENALKNLEKHENKVDYIISHDIPIEILKLLFSTVFKYEVLKPNNLETFLQQIYDSVEFKKFYAGHIHEEVKFKDNFEILYRNLIKID